MKKLLILCAMLFLTGCAPQVTFETVNDDIIPPVVKASRLQLELPEEAALLTGATDADSLYFCDGYTLWIQTLEGGDLDASFQTLTGFTKDSLTVMQRMQNGVYRYDTAWTTLGDGGARSARLTLFDDGNHHYAVTVMADAAGAGQIREAWEQVLASACLVSTD